MKSEEMSNIGPSRGTDPTPAVIHNLAQARQRKSERQAASADATGITTAGQELSRANAIVSAMQDARTERVQSLKQRIDSGQYQPDPEAIARRLLGGENGER
jgi:flagellar biosynthesis anti-sigma factor FlgM